MMRSVVCALVLAAAAQGGPTLADDLWIEASGGWATLRSGDLNARADYGDQAQLHLFDAQLAALQGSGAIKSWSKTESNGRPRVRSSWSGGLGVQYRLERRIAVSLGLQYLSAGSSGDWKVAYTRENGQVGFDRDIEEIGAAPDAVSVRAYAPTLGVHLRQALGAGFEGEAFMRAGPVFARFEYLTHWSYGWARQEILFGGSTLSYTVFRREVQSDERGNGIGASLEAGLHLRRSVGHRIAFFAEGGYAARRVSAPAGSGTESTGGEPATWKGDWVVETDRIAAPWGSIDIERPTARSSQGGARLVRDFRLDLSGVQLRGGVSFRF